jgi:Domain of unknown function (DUF1857)
MWRKDMIFSEIRLPANPEGLAPLTLEQVWQGLEQKARDAVPYVEAITSCRVIAEENDTVFDREIELGGARYLERVRLAAPRLVVFTRLDGPVLGTITNEIVDDDGELGLRFQFALTARPGNELPVSETELAAQMTSAYQVAVETTLAAVRAQLAGAGAGGTR